MTATNIIKAVLELLGQDASVASDATSTERTLLLRCLNMIVREIAEEYVDFKVTEDVEVTDGRVYYSALSREVRTVTYVKKKGYKLEFCEDDVGIKVATTGTVSVTYLYHPAEITIDGTLNVPRCVSERALVYGTASEYCLMKELYEECVNFNSRYVRALTATVRPKREIKVKERLWR